MNLQPVDFKAVAAKGAYVYCYLREDGRPYYIGIGTTPCRPFQKNHNCPVPYEAKDRWRARLMRSGLTWEMACEWEKRYIAQYGRKSHGGILWNRTEGGDGRFGYVPSEEERINAAKNSRTYSISQMESGEIETFGIDPVTWYEISQSDRAAVRYFCTAHPEVSGPDYLAGNYTKAQQTEAGRKKQKELNQRAIQRKLDDACKKYEVDAAYWTSLTAKQRSLVSSRYSKGTRGAELFAHLDNESGLDSRSLKAAEKYGITPQEYSKMDKRGRAIACKRFLRGLRGADLTSGLIAV